MTLPRVTIAPHGLEEDLELAERTIDHSLNVTTAVVTVCQPNKLRTALWLVNASDTDIQIGLGWEPVATIGSQTGLLLRANGGSLELNKSTLYKGLVYARHAGTGNKRLCAVELESRYANI